MSPSPPKSNARPRAFLAAYRRLGCIARAAAACGIDRTLHYRWLKHEKYAAAFATAQEHFADALEGEAARRSFEGVLTPIFYQGEPVGAERVFSDGLTMFLLRGMKPEKYSAKIQADLNVTGSLELVERLNAARKRMKLKADD